MTNSTAHYALSDVAYIADQANVGHLTPFAMSLNAVVGFAFFDVEETQHFLAEVQLKVLDQPGGTTQTTARCLVAYNDEHINGSILLVVDGVNRQIPVPKMFLAQLLGYWT